MMSWVVFVWYLVLNYIQRFPHLFQAFGSAVNDSFLSLTRRLAPFLGPSKLITICFLSRTGSVRSSPPSPMPLPMTLRNRYQVLSLTGYLVAAVALVTASGCSSGPIRTVSQTTVAQELVTSDTPPSGTKDGAACEDDVRGDLQYRISAQIEALGRNAFEEARGHASPSFRQNVTPEAFRALIQSGFSFLLSGQPAAFGRCRIVDGTATVEARFSQVATVTLIYFLVWWEDQWWIDGASPAVNPLSDKVEAS